MLVDFKMKLLDASDLTLGRLCSRITITIKELNNDYVGSEFDDYDHNINGYRERSLKMWRAAYRATKQEQTERASIE